MTILLHKSIHFLHKSKSLQYSHSPVRQHSHRSLHYRNSLHKYSLYHVTYSVRYMMTYLCWLCINVCSGLCICVLGSSTKYNMISTVLYSFSRLLQPCKRMFFKFLWNHILLCAFFIFFPFCLFDCLPIYQDIVNAQEEGEGEEEGGRGGGGIVTGNFFA